MYLNQAQTINSLQRNLNEVKQIAENQGIKPVELAPGKLVFHKNDVLRMQNYLQAEAWCMSSRGRN